MAAELETLVNSAARVTAQRETLLKFTPWVVAEPETLLNSRCPYGPTCAVAKLEKTGMGRCRA